MAVRLLGVSVVIFLANAGLLVLQLVAGRLLAPFVGSSLETWTVIIAAFLAGIALGNALGGRIADRSPTTGKLSTFLLLGGLGALWMIALPWLLNQSEAYKTIPLGARIPLLAVILCFPVAFVLSLLTPLAIRLGVPDVGRTGSVAGLIFALSTLGCLLGNYLTGFVLIPNLMVNTIVLTTAGSFFGTAGLVLAAFREPASAWPDPVPETQEAFTSVAATTEAGPNESIEAIAARRGLQVLPLYSAYAIVVLCSFAGMTLELASTRLLAQMVGVSLYTWTGVIGVMLAGTALGNFLGGQIADRIPKIWNIRILSLAAAMIAAAVFTVASLVIFSIFNSMEAEGGHPFKKYGLIEQILGLTFSMFFMPMFLLGMVSPQVIRLAVPDVRVAGRVAGRVYAVSTLGAILGTFATGYLLISSLGVVYTILLAAIFPILAVVLIRGAFQSSTLLYFTSAAMGAVVGGFILRFNAQALPTLETNYYTIQVGDVRPAAELDPQLEPLAALIGTSPIMLEQRELYKHRKALNLDHLLHSVVDLRDPLHLHYQHEQIQVEMVRRALDETPQQQHVLVIGGGGYTFPRYVRVGMPTAQVDVVEIDPGVTKVAYSHLGLKPEWNIQSHHMDGRQFVAEKSRPGTYDVITLDAVNDFSVPWHLLTLEFNEAVKKTLKPDGVYLVTVIDLLAKGQLWKASVHTLRKSFKHVELVMPQGTLYARDWELLQELFDNPEHLARLEKNEPDLPEKLVQMRRLLNRSVIVLYASDRPLDKDSMDDICLRQTRELSRLDIAPQSSLNLMLSHGKDMVLTDQFAPVDNLMAEVFRKR